MVELLLAKQTPRQIANGQGRLVHEMRLRTHCLELKNRTVLVNIRENKLR